MDTVEKFFLDLIGTVVPGCVLMTLCSLLFTVGYSVDWGSLPIFPDESPWILILGISYVVGHGMASFGEFLLVRMLDWFLGLLRKCKILKTLLGRSLAPQRDMFAEIEGDPLFIAFVELCRSVIPALTVPSRTSLPVLTWRSLAMSFAPNQRQTVYRFMFLSLLNLGVATSLIIAAVGTVSVWICHLNHWLPSVLAPTPEVALLLLAAAFFFVERRYYFNRVSTTIPFGMAVAELSKSQSKTVQASIFQSTTALKSKCIYLAGGFHSGWQQTVIAAIPEAQFKNPRAHGLKDKSAYTLWDLEAIRDSDLVFAYLEASNPGGYALALEVGFAKPLNKRIIFVNEKHAANAPEISALHMVEATADVTFNSLEEGLMMLRKICGAL